MEALYLSFIVFACVLLLSCAILCIPTVIYASSWLLSEAFSLYIDYKLIQTNKTDIYKLTTEYEDE